MSDKTLQLTLSLDHEDKVILADVVDTICSVMQEIFYYPELSSVSRDCDLYHFAVMWHKLNYELNKDDLLGRLSLICDVIDILLKFNHEICTNWTGDASKHDSAQFWSIQDLAEVQIESLERLKKDCPRAFALYESLS